MRHRLGHDFSERMDNAMKPNTLPHKMTPLWVIALFVSVAETVAGVSLSFTAGWVQGFLAVFVAVFAVGVVACFFGSLWFCPHKLYSPSDYPVGVSGAEFKAILYQKQEDAVDTTESMEVFQRTAETLTAKGKSSTEYSTSQVVEIIKEGFSDARRAEIEAKLSREIERLSFCDIDLQDVFTFLREYSDVNLWVDWRALVEIGVEGTTKMSVDVRKVSVRDALDILFESLNSTMPPDIAIVYTIRGNVVRVTTTLAVAREKDRKQQQDVS